MASVLRGDAEAAPPSAGSEDLIDDTMRFVACEVEALCVGQAGSSAAVLPAADSPGHRHTLPGARVVIQQPALEEPVRGQPSDLGFQARELPRERELLTAMPTRRTGRSTQEISAAIERDTILDAPAAVAFGLVDSVVANRTPSQPPHHAR